MPERYARESAKQQSSKAAKQQSSKAAKQQSSTTAKQRMLPYNGCRESAAL
jgi:hypothetical protein